MVDNGHRVRLNGVENFLALLLDAGRVVMFHFMDSL